MKLLQAVNSSSVITRFFYKQHFYKQRLKLAKIKQTLNNTLRLNLGFLKIIVYILHPHYLTKIIGHTLKNKQKKIYVCILYQDHDENEDEKNHII